MTGHLVLGNEGVGCWLLVVGCWYYSTKNHDVFDAALSRGNLGNANIYSCKFFDGFYD